MNLELLREKMKKNGDNNISLAFFLGVNRKTIGMKMKPDANGKRYDFTQEEISKIATRYKLTNDEICEIFFDGPTRQESSLNDSKNI